MNDDDAANTLTNWIFYYASQWWSRVYKIQKKSLMVSKIVIELYDYIFIYYLGKLAFGT